MNKKSDKFTNSHPYVSFIHTTDLCVDMVIWHHGCQTFLRKLLILNKEVIMEPCNWGCLTSG